MLSIVIPVFFFFKNKVNQNYFFFVACLASFSRYVEIIKTIAISRLGIMTLEKMFCSLSLKIKHDLGFLLSCSVFTG